MTGNTTLPGTNEVYAADAILESLISVHYQRAKLTLGADGINDGDVSTSNPMPVRDGQIKQHTALGTGTALNSTLIPTVGVPWRLLNIKFHVTSTATQENFVAQEIDTSEARFNAVLLTQSMISRADVVQQYDGMGLLMAIDRRVTFTWTNTDAFNWGLTVSYIEDTV